MNECNNRLSYNVVKGCADRLLKKLMDLPIGYFDRHSTGEVVSRIIADADQFSDNLLMGSRSFYRNIHQGTLIFMLSINVGTAVAVAAITPVSLVVASIIAKSTYSMFTKQAECVASDGIYKRNDKWHKGCKGFWQGGSTQAEFDKINKGIVGCIKEGNILFINSQSFNSFSKFAGIHVSSLLAQYRQ